MFYTGAIIRESLTDTSVLNDLELVTREVEKVDEDMKTPWLDVWTIDTVKIPENKIAEVCQQLSLVIDDSNCDDWYADFRNDDWLYVVFKNRVFKIDRHNPDSYAAMKTYALSHNLPEYQLPQP